MEKQVTFSFGKTKEKVDVYYETKPIKEIQKVMKKLSKETPDANISAFWEVDGENEIGGFEFLESYNYRQEAKKL